MSLRRSLHVGTFHIHPALMGIGFHRRNPYRLCLARSASAFRHPWVPPPQPIPALPRQKRQCAYRLVATDVLATHRYEGKGKAEASPYPRPSQRLFRLVAGAVVHGILPPFINRHLVTSPITIVTRLCHSWVPPPQPIPACDTQLRG